MIRPDSMAVDEILLYDLSRRGGNKSWSWNVWKSKSSLVRCDAFADDKSRADRYAARLVLNYKQIPYRTVWLSHPEIEPTLKSLGMPPSSDGGYTVPTIRLPFGEYIMDSTAIAKKLEVIHLSPSLHLETGTQDKAKAVMGRLAGPLLPVFMPRIGRNLIVDSALEHFYSTKKKGLGMSLDEFEAAKGGEQAWQAAQPGLEALKALLTDNKVDQGPFILGSKVSYGDFVVVAMLEGLRRIDQKIYDRIAKTDVSVELLHRACKKWMENDE